jgi:hypothetical protein
LMLGKRVFFCFAREMATCSGFKTFAVT